MYGKVPYRSNSILFKMSWLLLTSLMILQCDGKKRTVLAEFNQGAILESEYIDHFLLSTQYKPKVMPTEENLREIVLSKALDKIMVQEALARGLDKDSTLQTMVRNQGRKIVFYKYMQQEIFPQVITDSLMKQFYDHYSPQYNMKYIIRPVLQSSTPVFERTQKDTIEWVHRLLQSGKKFADLANRYSQDITTNQKGGDLGFVIRESLGDAALRTVMDTLKDFTYSKPFRGYEGYYILYKGEQRRVPVPAFSAVKDRIWQTLYRTRRHNIQQAVAQRFQWLADKYHYQLVQDSKEALLAKVGVDEKTSEFKMLDFSVLQPKDLSRILARYHGGAIRVAELFENRRREPQNLIEFNERLNALAEQHLLGQHGMELGLQNDAEITTQLDRLQDSWLRNNLLQMMVKDKVATRIDSLKAALPAQEKPEQLKKLLSQKYFEYERELKQNYENQLKKKFHFRFIESHFAAAMDKARSLKEEQNKKKSPSDPNKPQPE